jgi:NADH-quinone oxidoreductase subunit L
MVGVGIAATIKYGLIGLAVASISFFLFYVGVGGFDNKIIDGLVNFIAYLGGFLGLLARRIQTGKVQTYITFALIGVMVFFLWFK